MMTTWKDYSERVGSPASYAFQIRRVDNNALLISRSITVSATTRFKNIAVVIKGVIGGSGTNAFAANQVNYY